MASLRGLAADRQPLEEFKARARRFPEKQGDTSSAVIPLHLFEWSETAFHGHEITGLKSVEELETQSRGTVRVV